VVLQLATSVVETHCFSLSQALLQLMLDLPQEKETTLTESKIEITMNIFFMVFSPP
jgi:hypothetical protein